MKQGENTRAHIIAVSNDLFYRQGYGNTSFADIVNKTGLSKGNITYHFKNKQKILESIVNKRLEDISSMLQTWQQDINEPLQRLIRFCDILINEQDRLRDYGCPMGTLTGEFAKNAPELYQITLPMFQCFRDWLNHQFMQLGLRPSLADEKALELLSRAQGISVITHAFKDKKFLTTEVEKLKHSIQQEFANQ